MCSPLSRLREDLDFLPSPIPDRPGLLIRDPFRYSDVAIVIPPALVQCLTCFDGHQTDRDLRAMMVRLTGRPDSNETADGLTRGLSESGFLDDAVFHGLRDKQQRAFAGSAIRKAAYAGGGYPENRSALSATMEKWVGRSSEVAPGPVPAEAAARPQPSARKVVAIAAPHVSPAAGRACYGAAYRSLGMDSGEQTFVILGTSHYGRPGRFGLTRKTFETPLGDAPTDTTLVDRLVAGAPDSFDVEDYCHAVEHSIEFQVIFLQTLFGPSVRILPILCGPFLHETGGGTGTSRLRRPEDDPMVARALGALGELQAAHGERLTWVLGVDMAHVGRRYGDDVDARAHQGALRDVAVRDRARLDRLVAGDADGFWEALHERGHDDLKWCGAAPLYSFVHAHPGVRGRIVDYDQWNIDEQSVVSFAALAFER